MTRQNSGFFNPGIIDVLCWLILCGGKASMCIVGYLAGSLASIHWIPEVPYCTHVLPCLDFAKYLCSGRAGVGAENGGKMTPS